jgi:serine/threonine-protein kinase
MAPEQITDGHTVDGRADLWSLGVVMYELLTGRAPFEAGAISHLYVKILHEEPTPIGRLVPDVPAGLESAVMACLVKDRRARVQTAAELRISLLPFASPLPGVPRTPRPEAEVPSFRAGAVSIRVGAPATSDARALDATLAAPGSRSRGRLFMAVGVAIVASVVAYAGLQRGKSETGANVSASNEAMAPQPSVTVIPAPSVTASTPSGPGVSAPPEPSQTSSTAATAEPMSPAVGPAPKPRTAQAPSTSSQPAAPRVKELRDIRPLE